MHRVSLGDFYIAVSEPIADGEEIVVARFVETLRPRFPQGMSRQAMRVVTCNLEKNMLDVFFRGGA